ncbi:unnamed protein product [Mycena citricolor]|uniref:C2H2-type domain-containing protein n=1 Tax=Mycena citricolor TaxID=2018698 RepID=A0AAD2H6M1_9AGAR|nr:unnamed protein product [Mycena citricolor]
MSHLSHPARAMPPRVVLPGINELLPERLMPWLSPIPSPLRRSRPHCRFDRPDASSLSHSSSHWRSSRLRPPSSASSSTSDIDCYDVSTPHRRPKPITILSLSSPSSSDDSASALEFDCVQPQYDSLGRKNYACGVCGKAFTRPSILRIHARVHTRAKRACRALPSAACLLLTPRVAYRCPFSSCGREFSVNSNMRRHFRNHSDVRRALECGLTIQVALGRFSGRHGNTATRGAPGEHHALHRNLH